MVKEIADVVVMPLVVALLLAMVGCLLRLARRPRTSWTLLVSAAVLAYLSSISPVGQTLMRPLERRYAPLADDRLPSVE